MNAGLAAVSCALFSKSSSTRLIDLAFPWSCWSPASAEFTCFVSSRTLCWIDLSRVRDLSTSCRAAAWLRPISRVIWLSQILQGSADASQLRIGVAVILAEIGLALDQLRLLAAQHRDRSRSNDFGHAVCPALSTDAGTDPGRPRFVFGKIGSGGDQLAVQAGELLRQGAAVLGGSGEMMLLAVLGDRRPRRLAAAPAARRSAW